MMKSCPKCGKTYTDAHLNFCLEDGELLMQQQPQPASFDDSPPTVMINEARVTNPASGWQSAPPPAPYQQPQMYAAYNAVAGPNQTLAVVSLCLGIGSVTVGWCCSLGLLLAPAALITGFIALNQTKKDPARYSGRGLAIGGMVTGGVFLAIYLLVVVFYGAAILFGGLQ